MSDNVNVTNFPSDKSHYRVAFDLMKEIKGRESGTITSANAREYFLTLYKQCYQVVYNGYTFEEATGAKKRPVINFG